MNTPRKVSFALLFAIFFAFLPTAHASADSGRYFVKSTKNFWKNTLGVRNVFDNGFSADLSDFQVRLAQMFGLEIEPVRTLQISENGSQPVPVRVALQKFSRGSKATRILPSVQVPWGVLTTYDKDTLTSTSGGSGVNVAVLDTGVYSEHPDLFRRVSQCKDFTQPKSPVVNNKCEDKNGHGTHIAGIISANSGADGRGIYGISPSANIFAYKVCGNDGSCYADDVATGLKTAVDQGANVVNMSFGSGADISLIHDAVRYASSKDVLMVAAAGNEGLAATDQSAQAMDYPAAYAEVIGVGAVNQSLNVTDWSSRGTNETTTPWEVQDGDIEFAAPGEYIESTWNNGGFVFLSGTSMSSAFVAGLATKYWQNTASKGEEATSTRAILHSLARSLDPEGKDNGLSGYGLPQVK